MNSKFMRTFICSFLAVIMFACADCSDSFKLLTDADRLMESNIDSALTLLNRIDTAADLREDGRKALYYLLLTQAQYKKYRPVTADSMLNFSLEYYKRIGDDEKLARTYYYMGMIAYDRKQYETSIPQLKEGLGVAKNLNNDELISKYYESLCNVNIENQDLDTGLKYARLFLELSQKMNNYEYIIRGYDAVALAFRKMEMNDSADIYYKKVLPLLNKVGKKEKACIMTNIGCMYLWHHDFKMAKQYFEQSLVFEFRYNTIAALSHIYFKEGNIGKATELYNCVMKTDKPHLKMRLMKCYAEYYTQHGNFNSASAIYKQLSDYVDSLRTSQSKNIIAELEKKYDKTEAEHRRETAEMRLWIILSLSLAGFFGFISAIMIIIRYYKRIIKRMKRLTKKIRREYVSVLEEKQEQMDKISETIKELEKDRAKNEKAIQKLHKKMADIKQNLCMRLGRGRNIFNKIKNGMEVFLKKNDERSYLIDYYSIREYKTFYRWNMKYAKLTSGLLVFLILCDMGIGDDRIKEILGISDTTIRANRSKLKKQEKGNTGEDWEELEKLEELDGLEEQEDLEVEPC